MSQEPTQKVDWNTVQTVFVDMDGTLLDLYFDNYFWLDYLPRRYAEQHDIPADHARRELEPRFQAVEGTLNWYCLDYWSGELGLDIITLKSEIQHLISVMPHVHEFLHAVRGLGKRLVLVTNAHGSVLNLKMNHTDIGEHFDLIISSHEIGVAKEGDGFWGKLQGIEAFEPRRSLLLDDSLRVLEAARRFGIAHLIAMCKPDSRLPAKEITGFSSIETLDEIMP